MTPERLLLSFLKAAVSYGSRAGQVDERFCRHALGINDPSKAVAALARQGFPVHYNEEGIIAIRPEVMQ